MTLTIWHDFRKIFCLLTSFVSAGEQVFTTLVVLWMIKPPQTLSNHCTLRISLTQLSTWPAIQLLPRRLRWSFLEICKLNKKCVNVIWHAWKCNADSFEYNINKSNIAHHIHCFNFLCLDLTSIHSWAMVLFFRKQIKVETFNLSLFNYIVGVYILRNETKSFRIIFIRFDFLHVFKKNRWIENTVFQWFSKSSHYSLKITNKFNWHVTIPFMSVSTRSETINYMLTRQK